MQPIRESSMSSSSRGRTTSTPAALGIPAHNDSVPATPRQRWKRAGNMLLLMVFVGPWIPLALWVTSERATDDDDAADDDGRLARDAACRDYADPSKVHHVLIYQVARDARPPRHLRTRRRPLRAAARPWTWRFPPSPSSSSSSSF